MTLTLLYFSPCFDLQFLLLAPRHQNQNKQKLMKHTDKLQASGKLRLASGRKRDIPSLSQVHEAPTLPSQETKEQDSPSKTFCPSPLGELGQFSYLK